MSTVRPAQRQAVLSPWLLAGAVLVLGGAYWPAVASILQRWNESGPYDHGWLALAAVSWMALRSEARGHRVERRAFYGAVVVLAALSVAWAMARLANVTVAAQGLFVCAVLCTVYAWGGSPLLKRLAWPGVALIFAVPIWDAAIPLLQAIAVVGTSLGVALLRLPAAVDGNVIRLPSGAFEVAEGCSGLRFFLAAMTLATLAGEIAAVTFAGRCKLLVVGAMTAIAGNWLRILTIIVIGHLTHMQHPVVEDHAWVGWITFAILVIPALLLCSVGLRGAGGQPRKLQIPRLPNLGLRTIPLAAAALVLPVAAQWIEAVRYADAEAAVSWPASAGQWLGPVAALCPWDPVFPGAALEACALYEPRGDSSVVVAGAVAFTRQARGRELVGGAGRPEGAWSVIGDEGEVATGLAAPRHAIGKSVAPVSGPPWRLWYWYALGSMTSVRQERLKLAEASALPPAEPAALMMVAVPCRGSCLDADATLRRFLADHPEIATAVRRVDPAPAPAHEAT